MTVNCLDFSASRSIASQDRALPSLVLYTKRAGELGYKAPTFNDTGTSGVAEHVEPWLRHAD